MKALLYCAICAMCLGSALAYDGNGILEACKNRSLSGDESTYFGVCLGYTIGVAETANMWQGMTNRRGFCMPAEAWKNPEQIIRAAVKYLEDNPAELHKNAALLVQRAIVEAFPCTEGN